jgi:polyferredoxin
MPRVFIKYLRRTPTVLLWVSLVLILISQNPTISAYEPFALLFSLEGAGIQWYILPASLIGSMFVSDFFCNFFCPVGAGFGWLRKNRNQLIKTITNKQL